ncbi:MAG: hypothetical protein LH645_11050 [Actinomycetia bacterium]|nr:hypothetical protein [Actinomycetes bacterium]
MADSEVFFYLAHSFGLCDDPPTAVARAARLIEEVAPLQHRRGDFAPLLPDNEVLQRLSSERRLVASEPLTDLPGIWNEVPE